MGIQNGIYTVGPGQTGTSHPPVAGMGLSLKLHKSPLGIARGVLLSWRSAVLRGSQMPCLGWLPISFLGAWADQKVASLVLGNNLQILRNCVQTQCL